MLNVGDIADALGQLAPASLAEEWDNVGLLVGDRQASVSRVMTCLTVTPASAAEAISGGANLVVTHHPLPFRPLKRLTTDTTVGRLLLDLIAARVAVYSPHTSFDSAPWGINQRLAEGLDLCPIAPLVEFNPPPNRPPGDAAIGSGRWGQLPTPTTLGELAERLKAFLKIDRVQCVGPSAMRVASVAVACGSGGSFLEYARNGRYDCLVTGETNFHTCLEAEALGVGLLLAGHFASERFALELLADYLQAQFPAATVWASRDERDPLRWL